MLRRQPHALRTVRADRIVRIAHGLALIESHGGGLPPGLADAVIQATTDIVRPGGWPVMTGDTTVAGLIDGAAHETGSDGGDAR